MSEQANNMIDKTKAVVELYINQAGKKYTWVLSRDSYMLNDQIQEMLYGMKRLLGDIFKGSEYTITSYYYSDDWLTKSKSSR